MSLKRPCFNGILSINNNILPTISQCRLFYTLGQSLKYFRILQRDMEQKATALLVFFSAVIKVFKNLQVIDLLIISRNGDLFSFDI